MGLQREWLVRAAVELGLRVDTDHVVKLAGGRAISAEAYFPDLGTPDGWAVFPAPLPADVERELVERGYPASFYGAPDPRDSFDLDDYAEMFAEWGWSGHPALKPDWMNASENEPEDEPFG